MRDCPNSRIQSFPSWHSPFRISLISCNRRTIASQSSHRLLSSYLRRFAPCHAFVTIIDQLLDVVLIVRPDDAEVTGILDDLAPCGKVSTSLLSSQADPVGF